MMHVGLARQLCSILILGVLGCSSTRESPDPASGDDSAQVANSELMPPPGPSKEEGKKAFEKGLGAVKDGQFGVAARYFNEARRADPYAPQNLFNLGLAYSKAGNEFLAIPWLEAYLAVQPDAPNAPAVRNEIEKLEKSGWDKVSMLLEKAKAAADKLEDVSQRKSAWGSIARSRAASGDVEGALTLHKLVYGKDPNPNGRSSLWKDFVQQLLQPYSQNKGDLRRALEVLPHITEESHLRELFQFSILPCLGKSGRTTEMMSLVAQSPAAVKEELMPIARENLARQYFKKGEFVAVEELLPSLRADDCARLLWNMAESRCDSGDLTGARRLIDRIEVPLSKMRALQALAVAQLSSGDAAAAKATAREILPLSGELFQFFPASKIVATVILGNAEAAVVLANSAHELQMEDRPKWWGLIIEICVLAGDLKSAEALMDQFIRTPYGEETPQYKPFHGGRPEWGMARGLIEKGSPAKAFAYYMKTSARIKAELLPDLVDAFIKAGDYSGAERSIWAVRTEDYEDLSFSYFLRVPAKDVLAPAQMSALIKIARANAAKKSPEEAKRLLREACLVAAANGATDGREETLRQVVDLQVGLGDSQGAQETSALIPPVAASRWIYLANALANSASLSNFEQGLRSALKEKPAEEVPGEIARYAASTLGGALFGFRATREMP